MFRMRYFVINTINDKKYIYIEKIVCIRRNKLILNQKNNGYLNIN